MGISCPICLGFTTHRQAPAQRSRTQGPFHTHSSGSGGCSFTLVHEESTLRIILSDPPPPLFLTLQELAIKGLTILPNQPFFCCCYPGMEVSFTQNGNAPNTPYQAAPANAPSLIEKVTGLAPPSSSLLDFILLRTKNNGALEERGKTGRGKQLKA